MVLHFCIGKMSSNLWMNTENQRLHKHHHRRYIRWHSVIMKAGDKTSSRPVPVSLPHHPLLYEPILTQFHLFHIISHHLKIEKGFRDYQIWHISNSWGLGRMEHLDWELNLKKKHRVKGKLHVQRHLVGKSLSFKNIF